MEITGPFVSAGELPKSTLTMTPANSRCRPALFRSPLIVRFLRPWATSLILFAGTFAASPAQRPFDLPAGDAAKTLRSFSEQSGEQIIFPVEQVRGVKTQAVKGQLTAREALDRMLAGTDLAVVQDAKTGALTVRKGVADPNGLRAVPTSASPARPRPKGIPDNDDMVFMSPFEVKTDADVGYIATSSLAGSRLNTNLGDIASQIFVFTPELMNDLAVSNIDDAMMYSANFETIREYADANNMSAGTRIINDNNNRIRGLESATTLLGMFSTYSNADSFNSERFTLASGPNAILFGLGNSGGVFDSTPKRAMFRRHNDIRLRTDNLGSRRAEVDANLPLIPKLLAARFAGLIDDKGHFRRPFRDDNRRFYTAITVTPFPATSVHVNAEWSHRDAQRTPLQLPKDTATGWIDSGRLPFDNSGTATINAALIAARAGANAYQFGANTNAAPVYVYGNSPALGIRSFAGTVTAIAPDDYPGILALDSILHGFNRPDLYPREVSPVGLTAPNLVSGRVFQIAVDQGLTPNLSLNLGYAHDSQFEKTGGYNGTPGINMLVDPNRFLPDRATPNPNFGKLYVEDVGNLIFRDNRQDAVRASLAYELDLTRRPDALRWFGRTRAAATWSWQVNDERSQTHQTLVGDGPAGPPAFVTGAAVTNYRATQRQFRMRYYLDTLSDPASQGRYFKTTPGGGNPQATASITDPVSGRAFPVYLSENPQGAFNAPAGTKREFSSAIVVAQNYLLRDRLVFTVGAREDAAHTARLDANSTAVLASGLYRDLALSRFEDFGPRSSRRSYSWGLVGHVRPWLSLRYNHATNKNPTTSQLDPYGAEVEGKSGVGSDYGFALKFLDGSVVAKANWFVNSQTSAPANTGLFWNGNNLRAAAYDVESRIRRDIDPGLAAAGLDPLLHPVGDYAVVSDFESRGVEYEVIANPTRNWRVFATAGLQRTRQSKSAEAWLRWVQERVPVWTRAGRGWDVETISDSSPQTIHDYYETTFVAQNLLPLLSSSDRKRTQQRDWRANLNTNYSFDQGPLRGVLVGGGGRYRSAATIGYGVKSVPKGTVIAGYNGGQPIAADTVLTDPEREYTSPANFWVDMMAAYELPGPRRDHRYRLQLNVRNLLDRQALLPSLADSNGVAQVWSFQYPREVIFSFSVSY